MTVSLALIGLPHSGANSKHLYDKKLQKIEDLSKAWVLFKNLDKKEQKIYLCPRKTTQKNTTPSKSQIVEEPSNQDGKKEPLKSLRLKLSSMFHR